MCLSLPATGVDALPIGTLTTRVLLHPDQRFCTHFAGTLHTLQNHFKTMQTWVGWQNLVLLPKNIVMRNVKQIWRDSNNYNENWQRLLALLGTLKNSADFRDLILYEFQSGIGVGVAQPLPALMMRVSQDSQNSIKLLKMSFR